MASTILSGTHFWGLCLSCDLSDFMQLIVLKGKDPPNYYIKGENTGEFSQGSFSPHCLVVSLLKTEATLMMLITSQDSVALCTE